MKALQAYDSIKKELDQLTEKWKELEPIIKRNEEELKEALKERNEERRKNDDMVDMNEMVQIWKMWSPKLIRMEQEEDRKQELLRQEMEEQEQRHMETAKILLSNMPELKSQIEIKGIWEKPFLYGLCELLRANSIPTEILDLKSNIK